MRRPLLIAVLLLSGTGLPAVGQDTAEAGRKKPAPELSEPVTIKLQYAVPRCAGGYWLRVVNRTAYPLEVSLGQMRLGTAPPDERAWTFRIPSEMIETVPVRGITFRSVGGPAPSEALLWDEFRVLCGR
jgi:hypothetical protein